MLKFVIIVEASGTHLRNAQKKVVARGVPVDFRNVRDLKANT